MNPDSATWVLSRKLAEETGLTVKAIDRKRQRGIWTEGVHYRMMDGRIYYSIVAYNAWVEGRSIRGSSSTAMLSVSRSRTKTNAAGN